MHAETTAPTAARRDDVGLAAWSVDLTDLPPGAGTGDLLRFVARYGMLAPSSHNTQPWLFHVRDGGLDVIGDTRRGLPVTDPFDRELVISCGAVVENITLALARLGYRSNVDVLPDPRDPELYARITLSGATVPSDDEVLLFDQIPRRHTSRVAFDPRPLSDELVRRLRADAAAEGTSLVVVGPGQVDDVTALVMEADLLQMADPRFRRELAAWLTGRRRRDGMTRFAIEVGGIRIPPRVTPFIARTFDVGQGRAARDSQLVEHSALLAAITTRDDDIPNWLAAGRTLQSVLLRARADGVWASFLNQPIEVDELRPRLATALGDGGVPQLLLRLGYGPAAAPTHRRDVDDCFVY